MTIVATRLLMFAYDLQNEECSGRAGGWGHVGQGAGGWFWSQKDILYCYFSLMRHWCSKFMRQAAEVIN